MGSSRDHGAQTSPGPCCPLWNAPPGSCWFLLVSAAHEAGMQHVRLHFLQGHPQAPSSSLPCLLCPIPGWGCPLPSLWGSGQRLWVRKRNLVSKLGLDMIVAEPQKLSSQTPQTLGKLLSKTSENRRTLYKYHLSSVVLPCSYPASICVKNSKNKTSEN